MSHDDWVRSRPRYVLPFAGKCAMTLPNTDDLQEPEESSRSSPVVSGVGVGGRVRCVEVQRDAG